MRKSLAKSAVEKIVFDAQLRHQINWLLDVIASTREAKASVIANFKQVVKEGDLRLHPLVTRLVDKETLEKMGARPSSSAQPHKEEAS